MFINLTLTTGPIIRLNIDGISAYAKYYYDENEKYKARYDNFTTVYVKNIGNITKWTVKESPEEIDVIIEAKLSKNATWSDIIESS